MTGNRDLDLTGYLPYLLNRAGTRIADSFSVLLRQRFGITLQMWRVLAALYYRDGQRVGELSETTSIEISTLSRMLTGMAARELVERRRPDGDARVVAINLTADGRALTARIVPEAMRYETAALMGFSTEETALLKQMLMRLFDNMSDLEGDAEQKLAS